MNLKKKKKKILNIINFSGTLTYWSLNMKIESNIYGFIESYIKINVFQAIQQQAVNLPRPENVEILTVENFQYTSKYLLSNDCVISNPETLI